MSSPAIPPLAIHSHRTPNRFFTPTHMEFHDVSTRIPTAHWQSRRARKGRYEPKVARVHTSIESDGHEISGRVRHLESELKPGLRADISFWVAVAFTLGSAVWVVNGMFYLFCDVECVDEGLSRIYRVDAGFETEFSRNHILQHCLCFRIHWRNYL